MSLFQDGNSASKQRIEAFVSEVRHKRRPSLAFRISSDNQSMLSDNRESSMQHSSKADFKFKLHVAAAWRSDFVELFNLLKEVHI